MSHHNILFVITILVIHPRPGTKIQAKILDKDGIEVSPSEYDLEIDNEDFTFKFKKPHRSRSGKYTLVFSNEGAEATADIYVNFLGEKPTYSFCPLYLILIT